MERIYLLLIMLILSFGSCNKGNTLKKVILNFKIEGVNSKKILSNDTIRLGIITNDKIKVDSTNFFLNNFKLDIIDSKTILKNSRVGKQNFKAIVYYENGIDSIDKEVIIYANSEPNILSYKLMSMYPHDPKAYTQGLEFYNDTLYESTGRKGQSSLRKVDHKTGEILKKIDLNAQYFGEGITIINDKIYMLTWLKGTGFVFDLYTFKKLDSFQYNQSKEGWGLCHGDGKIYKSDGSEKIWILDPESFQEIDYIQVTSNKSIYNRINELEYVNGKIYANQYPKDGRGQKGVMVINPETGVLEGVIDLRGLRKELINIDQAEAFNGIAYYKKNNSIFVTGKYWDKLFEIEIR